MVNPVVAIWKICFKILIYQVNVHIRLQWRPILQLRHPRHDSCRIRFADRRVLFSRVPLKRLEEISKDK